MKKPLLETFDNLNLTDRQAKLFRDVMVSRIVVIRKTKKIEIYIESSHIIAYREIGLLEYALSYVLKSAGYEVKVYDSFKLSLQYSPLDFWNEYKESILLILKEENILEFNMVYSGVTDIEGSIINISCEDDSMYRAREEKLAEIIKKIFKKKAAFEVSVNIKYTEPVTIEELPATGTYGADIITYKPPAGIAAKTGKSSTALPGNNQHQKITGKNTMPGNSPEQDYYENLAKTSLASEMFNAGTDHVPSGKKVSINNDNSKKKTAGRYKENSHQLKGSYKSQGFGKGATDKECFYGRNCEGDIIKIADIQGEVGEVVIEGKVVSTDEREIKNEKIIYMFNVTDFTDTISAKIFILKEEADIVREISQVQTGVKSAWIITRG